MNKTSMGKWMGLLQLKKLTLKKILKTREEGIFLPGLGRGKQAFIGEGEKLFEKYSKNGAFCNR